jgi:hypothetical protein
MFHKNMNYCVYFCKNLHYHVNLAATNFVLLDEPPRSLSLNFENANICKIPLHIFQYSIQPKAGLSEFRMVISRTLFGSDFRSAFDNRTKNSDTSLDRFIVEKIFYSCQNGLD